MKTDTSTTTRIHFASTHFASTFILLLAGIFLLGTARAPGAIFPTRLSGDSVTPSMGVFRIKVAPAFTNLFAPAVGFSGYLGYSSADARLTSPTLVDNVTKIGRSDPHDRIFVGSTPVGAPIIGNVGYPDYPLQPFIFLAAPAPTRELFTQMRFMDMLTVDHREQCSNDVRVPAVPPGWSMVRGGSDIFAAPRSLGMVQEQVANGAADPDFNARSFFDIFVEVALPGQPGTVSFGAFPGAGGIPGAVLYNGATDPLVVTNLDISMLPPVVVYIHGETAGVPLKFRFNNPPYWFADDVMGHLVLAGHGTFTNNCVSEAALLDATLGVVGTSKPEMPVPYLFPTDMCPSPGTTYNSVRDIDIVKFTIPGAGTVSVRNFVHSNILNPINPPPVNTSATYNFSNSVITAELSLNPGQWLPVQGNGPMAAMIRHGSNDTSNTRLFDTEMLQLNIAGNSPIGAFRLRESPTRQSLGKHTIRTAPQGFQITSFFDVFLDLSTDNGTTWIPADRAVHMAVDTAPPCGVGAVLHMTRSGTAATLYWSDTSYMLQFRPSFATTATWATLPGSSSPMTVNIGNQSGYYRLVCK